MEIADELDFPKNLCVLGIETSCDETAVALLKDGVIVGEKVMFQNDLHADFGGVVPELASRQHARTISDAISQTIEQSNTKEPEQVLDAIAVTYGPGLAGSLMVGVSAAKALSVAWDVPLVGVDHMEGHLFAGTLFRSIKLPSLTLLVSGGHSQLIDVQAPGVYKYLGGTLDDAVGEAFDKVARLLGLRFPGGPEIERLSHSGDASKITFPRGLKGNSLDMSFSGLKTSVLRYLEKNPEARAEDVAAAFQEAAVGSLVDKVALALKKTRYRSVVIGGGVAANSLLRAKVVTLCNKAGVEAVIPPKNLCTDNGAMIAAAGAYRFISGFVSPLDLSINPSLNLV